MPKKIYDIKPPKVVAKAAAAKRKPASSTRSLAGVRRTVTRKAVVRKPEGRFPWREIVIGSGVIVILLAAWGITKLPKAEILISPTTETLSLQETISADKAIDMVDMVKKVIPATVVTQEATASQQFPATGSAEDGGRATGTITIFNEISPKAAFTLKTGTHFLSDSGKYFVTLEKITIPAGGSIDAKVKATETGAEYNIGASKFSVPGLAGTTYYYSIYGSSKNAMTGGYAGKVKKVTQDDIDSAKDVLTKRLLEQAQAELQGKLSEDAILLEDAMTKTVASATVDAKVGAVADSINATVTVSISAVVFNRQDVQQFAVNDITANLEDNQNYLLDSLGVDYKINGVDSKEGIISMSLKIAVKTYENISTTSLVSMATGKSAEQIEAMVKESLGDKVQSTHVDFWPFWVKTAPNDQSRVQVKLNFE